MSLNLFKEIIPSLNLKTEHLFDVGKMVDKDYDSFMINKNFSLGEDILLANMMNMSYHLPGKMQYDFWFYGLEKQKRYNKWIKKQSINNVEDIKKYCSCSVKRAVQYSEVLSEEQIQKIKDSNSRTEDCVSK